jgi:hypothetical protein
MGRAMTVTIETTSLLILRSGNLRTAWCPVCGAGAQMLEFPTREFSTIGQLPPDVHRSEASDGVALICLNSLLAREQMAKASNGGPHRLPKTEKEGI